MGKGIRSSELAPHMERTEDTRSDQRLQPAAIPRVSPARDSPAVRDIHDIYLFLGYTCCAHFTLKFIYAYCYSLVVTFAATYRQLALLLHSASYTYCYTLPVTFTATPCQLPLLLHPASYLYCYALPATLNATPCQLPLMLHLASYP